MQNKIKVLELGDVIRSFADIHGFDPALRSDDKEVRLFLCALGFEPRCVSIPSELAATGHSFDHAVYFEYDTNRADNDSNLPALLENLSALSKNVQALGAYEADFYLYMRQLLEAIVAKAATTAKPVVVLDVSVASNRLIMRCMKVLLEFPIHLLLVYSEAAIYYPQRAEYAQDPERWIRDDAVGLEKGVRYVHTSEQYPGYHIDQLPDCVILFLSFRPERSRAVVSAVDPSLVVSPGQNVLWMLGVPHLPEDNWRIDAMRAINELTASSVQYEVSTFDYKDTLRTLESIYDERSESYRFTLSPIGSKMQAVGASLSCYLHPEVRVIFSAPQEFNASHYSRGCKAMWSIDFGDLSKIRTELDRVGEIYLVD
jgi:hypothetical protein